MRSDRATNPDPRRDSLYWLTAHELSRLVRTRSVSSVELVNAHLQRVSDVNGAVNAIVSLDPERALREAADADRALVSGGPVGRLHGLPTAFKDTHATAGLRTTYGSRIFSDNIPTVDDLVVERIRAAGAIALGKTNVPEFASGSHTFNTLFGVTRNPYDPARSAGGSSGGAAAALASGMIPLAEGSDMGGSLRNPASFCNVVGLRPSPGRVPEFPSELAWQTLSVQGPMGRTVADVALLLSVISGPDPRCPLSLEASAVDFAASMGSDLAPNLRIAWCTDFGGMIPVDPQVVDIVSSHVQTFSDLGCIVEEATPDLRGADEAFRTLRAWVFADSMGDLLRDHRHHVKESLAQNIEMGTHLSGADIARAERLHTQVFRNMASFFSQYDFLVTPTSQALPFDAGLEYPRTIAGDPVEDYLDWMRSCYYISVTGSPALSVPAGFTDDGLPVGLQIIGPPRSDRTVLEVGHAFEQATGFGLRHPELESGSSAPRREAPQANDRTSDDALTSMTPQRDP